jgi:hypothetical protein
LLCKFNSPNIGFYGKRLRPSLRDAKRLSLSDRIEKLPRWKYQNKEVDLTSGKGSATFFEQAGL